MPMSFIIFDERFCFALCENASAIILNLQNYHFFLIMANEGGAAYCFRMSEMKVRVKICAPLSLR